MPGQKSNVRKTVRLALAAKLAIAVTTSALSIGITGCGTMQVAQDNWSYNSSWNNFIVKHRNQGMAVKAWHARKHHFCNEHYLDEFCDGFQAGYLSVAEGGDGCTPSFAPRDYWSWEYQTAEGQRKVASWFAGFPHGCRAAEEAGIGNWSQLQSSYGVQNEYGKAGLLAENQHPGMYPMPEAVPAGQVYAQRPADSKPAETNVVPTPESVSPLDAPQEVPAPQGDAPNLDQSSYQGTTSRLLR